LHCLVLTGFIVSLGAVALAVSHDVPPARLPQNAGKVAAESRDREIGAQAAEQVARQVGVLNEGTASEYVCQIGARLVRHAPPTSFSYSFAVLDDVAPNAFALPGGYIYLSRGLLALVNSEDELANVLAHEISHAVLRHAAARQAMSDWLGPFSLGFVRVAQLASYSREQENEADRGGQEIAAAAGYDPHGMGEFLKRLDRVERLERGWSRLPTFYATHPTSAERIALTIGRAPHVPKTQGEPIAKDRAAFLNRLVGVMVGPNPAEGVFLGPRFVHVDMDFSLRIPDGWTPVNTSHEVGAFSPKGDARVALRIDSKGDDPGLAANEFLVNYAERLAIQVLREGGVQLGALSAYRIEGNAVTPAGRLAGLVTWVVHNGSIFRIGYVAQPSMFNAYKGRAVSVVRSFRPPTAEEIASIQVASLAVARAREGENLATFSSRVGNGWDLETTALMNGIFSSDTLTDGQLLKIAVAKPYVPESRP